jgi:predicted RNA-binding Zn-ribbon protein involved in translation (DUF1610 family)
MTSLMRWAKKPKEMICMTMTKEMIRGEIHFYCKVSTELWCAHDVMAEGITEEQEKEIEHYRIKIWDIRDSAKLTKWKKADLEKMLQDIKETVDQYMSEVIVRLDGNVYMTDPGKVVPEVVEMQKRVNGYIEAHILAYQSPCHTCQGTGEIFNGDHYADCHACEGSGINVKDETVDPLDGFLDFVMEEEEREENLACPRCGKNPIIHPLVRNALSRIGHVYVCSSCGLDEAIKGDGKRNRRASFRLWYLAKEWGMNFPDQEVGEITGPKKPPKEDDEPDIQGPDEDDQIDYREREVSV